MRIRTLVACIALGTGLVAAGTTPAFAQNTQTQAAVTENWMSISQIHDKLVVDGYRDITKIERERRGYEVEAVNAQGQRVELDVEPIRGDIVKTELD